MTAPFSTSAMEVRIKAARAHEHEGAAKGLFLATEHVLGVSNDRVPIEEHTLEISGSTHVDKDNLVGYVFYDTPYAVRQHEDLTLKHDAGRQGKYLESALVGERDVCRKLIADSIRGSL